MVARGICRGRDGTEPRRGDFLDRLSSNQTLEATKGCKQVAWGDRNLNAAPVEAQELMELVIRDEAVDDPPFTHMLETLKDNPVRDEEAREIDVRGFVAGGCHGWRWGREAAMVKDHGIAFPPMVLPTLLWVFVSPS
jgi:hypothetical protein